MRGDLWSTPGSEWTRYRRPDIWSAAYDVAALDRNFAASVHTAA